jgi:NhaP-type Na+/H+ or K+/H+ antiporter
LLIAGIVREVNKATSVPYTPMLFLVGMVLGMFTNQMGTLGSAIQTVKQLDPHSILMIFLPVLLFESGFNSDWHYFRKQLGQIITLAFPGVFMSAIFLLLSLKIILQYDDTYYTWSAAFMFGSILSCTDTVAVLALLKEAGAPKKFNR